MTKKTVFICEDDDGILDVMTIVLEEAGFRVVQMHDGHQVLAEIQRLQPAIVLLDLWMPTISGAELTRHLKKNAATAAIPVLLVSANRDTERIARDSGAEGFLAKPFDIDELVHTVRRLISKDQ
jgi:DNA-binding response OmpR family regulator